MHSVASMTSLDYAIGQRLALARVLFNVFLTYMSRLRELHGKFQPGDGMAGETILPAIAGAGKMRFPDADSVGMVKRVLRIQVGRCNEESTPRAFCGQAFKLDCGERISLLSSVHHSKLDDAPGFIVGSHHVQVGLLAKIARGKPRRFVEHVQHNPSGAAGIEL